jgi:dihydropteroate synthase
LFPGRLFGSRAASPATRDTYHILCHISRGKKSGQHTVDSHEQTAPIRLRTYLGASRRTRVMGILNVTPDSFSGDGLAVGGDVVARVVEQAGAFVADGADILDVGGESTRPGSRPVSAEEEAARVVPVIKALSARFPDTVVSIDTWKAAVAADALDAGAAIVNDVWALEADPDMPGLVAARGVPVILMHNRSRAGAVTHDSRVGGQYAGAEYGHLLQDVAADLEKLTDNAIAAGVDRAQIILDPGIGFGKSVTQNMALINHLDALKPLGFPLLIGPSRKSFIGQVLGVAPEEREEGTAAALALGIARGAGIVRVHDVKAMARVVRMTDAILATRPDGSASADGS